MHADQWKGRDSKKKKIMKIIPKHARKRFSFLSFQFLTNGVISYSRG
jgi:hypothetical protein